MPQATNVTSAASQYPTASNSGDLWGCYGATPVVQQAGYGAVTDSSGGTAALTNGILTLTSSYNSAIIANALATLAKQTNALEAALVANGILSV